jgi:hypothetical protein
LRGQWGNPWEFESPRRHQIHKKRDVRSHALAAPVCNTEGRTGAAAYNCVVDILAVSPAAEGEFSPAALSARGSPFIRAAADA